MSDTRYTHGHHDSVLRSHRWRTVENSAAYLVPYLAPSASLLDVGCGPGTITADFARRVTPARVVGIDRAQEIVTAAAEANTEANLSFSVGDVYALDFPDATFDVVHAHQVLQHLADPVAALVEMRRVCKPEGVVAARDSDYQAMTWFPAEPALVEWMKMYQAVARSNDGEPDAGRYLLAWAHGAGFSDVVASASAWCFATAPDRDWWSDLWAERVTESALGEQAMSLGVATRSELETMAAGWRRWAQDRSGWFAALHGEVICRP